MMNGIQGIPAFTVANISVASADDAPTILELVNSAYRGERSRRGWTTEADLIGGDVRIDEDALADVMNSPTSIVLKYMDEGQIIGCVNLQHKGDHLYLGMFSVSPEKQNAGIGRKLLSAAEEVATAWQLPVIRMSVIYLREELIAWYKRNGYIETGERIPFHEDGRTGNHLKKLEFIILEKKITKP